MIKTLSSKNKKILRDYFNARNEIPAKSIASIRKVLQVSNNNLAWDSLMTSYNMFMTPEYKLEQAIQKNREHFENRQSSKKNKYLSVIAKFLKSYHKPTNMEKYIKYGNAGIAIDANDIRWEKQFVDVYKIVFDHLINLTQDDDDILLFKTKVFSLLGNIYRKYKGGVIQLDLLGIWLPDEEYTHQVAIKMGNPDYVIPHNILTKAKVCIEAIELTPKNYNLLFDSIYTHMNPPNSNSEFGIKQVDIKFIKPLVGGCYSCKGHGKNLKLNNLTLHNPYSTNNNCFFKLIEEYLDFKPTKTKCNELRAEFGIAENDMISFQDCYKIAKKYCKSKTANPFTISFITNKLENLFGDVDGELKIFCLDNHYMSLVGETRKCKSCGQFYMNDNHKCNKNVQNFFNIKIKRLITPTERVHQNLLNKEILHYDIETQYSNSRHQHTPYIVGFCYYKCIEKKVTTTINPLTKHKTNKTAYTCGALEYKMFYGDNCMKEFYNFLGGSEAEHINYVNAYNGSGFDHYYLFREKLSGYDKIGKFILNNGNLLSAKIQNKTLVDLCRHLTGTLDSNLKQNGCSIAKGKIDHNLSKRWEETDEERKIEVIEYLKCDVLGLCELYEKVNDPIYTKYNINLCQKLTTSTNAFDIWKDKFLKDEIYLLDAEKDINARQAIYGARCYKNKNRFESSEYEKIINGDLAFDDIKDYIFDADVVSLYPTAMSKYPYPVGKEKITNIYQHNKLGIYKITYKAPKNLLNPILPRKVGKKLIWDLNDGSGWYSSVDIETAKSKGYLVTIITGYYWTDSGFVFTDYMNEFFKMKAEAQKGTPAYNTAKLYLNGLYGKMLQRPNHSKDCIIKTSKEFWVLLNKNIIQEMSCVGNNWLVKYISKPEYLTPSGAEKPTQLGVFILAYSRKIMSDYYDKCGNTIERLPFYYDTDSLNIHSSCLDNIKIDKSLGGIDDDVGGKVIKAFYIAPKMYAFQYINDKNEIKYHFRGKGVSNNSLTWEHFEKMDRGESEIFKRDFQMKKINMKKTGKEADYDHFSHKHIFGTTADNIENGRVNNSGEKTDKCINQTIWGGRLFIDDNNSVPFGFDLTLLKKPF